MYGINGFGNYWLFLCQSSEFGYSLQKDWGAMGAISYFYNKIWIWRFQTYWNQVNSSCRKEKEIGINLEEETRIGPYHNDNTNDINNDDNNDINNNNNNNNNVIQILRGDLHHSKWLASL